MGGGGGCEAGAAGAAPTGVILGLFEDGTAATSGVGATPGAGGGFSSPVSIPIGPVSLVLTPSGGGGNGGNFGQRGERGFLNLTLAATITIPIIGTITIPIPIPGGLLPLYGPTAGDPGNAIKRNSSRLIGLADGSYSTLFIKGNVGP